MDRAELEGLDRDALIARAEAEGVTRARILTRPELVDEVLLRRAAAGDRAAKRARGFFGRARDLLARVIELGLNLPDAADRMRGSTPPAPARTTTPALPTVTLAEIYAAQGHRERAIDTLTHVIEREPEHAAARALLAQLQDASVAVAAPQMPPEDDEPPPAPVIEEDEESSAPTQIPPAPVAPPAPPAPPGHAPPISADACVAIPSVDGDLIVRWQARDATLSRLAAAFPGGRGVLRVFVVNPTWDGPRSETRDLEVEPRRGERVLRGLPAGAIVRAAVGWRTDDGFAPIAHV